LWGYERKTHGGPVFGEGKYHWFWSGDLDGVEAQFGAQPDPITDGTKAPIFVDFDLSRIHPLQVNHGMGMYDRWLPNNQTITTVAQLDAYRMQEVIFGHAPYLSDSLWDIVPFAIREQNLVSPVAQSYAGQSLVSTTYEANGSWMNASSALLAGDFTRVQVTYANNLVVVANQDSSAMTWRGLTLPQSGWAAEGSNLLAYTAYRSGSIADYAQTANSLFADARNENDYLSFESRGLASPQVKQIAFNGTHSIPAYRRHCIQGLCAACQPIRLDDRGKYRRDASGGELQLADRPAGSRGGGDFVSPGQSPERQLHSAGRSDFGLHGTEGGSVGKQRWHVALHGRYSDAQRQQGDVQCIGYQRQHHRPPDERLQQYDRLRHHPDRWHGVSAAQCIHQCLDDESLPLLQRRDRKNFVRCPQ
jgi:hypothetical protein